MLPDRVEVSTAVVDDDALRVARGARGVVQGDGLPLVGGFVRARTGGPRTRAATRTPACRSARRGRCTRRRRRPPGPGAGPAGPRALAARRAEGAVDEQDLRLGVLEDERDAGGVEAGVERHQDGPRHGDPEVGLDHLGGVREQDAPRCRPARCRGRRARRPAGGTGRGSRSSCTGGRRARRRGARDRRRRSSRGTPAASAGAKFAVRRPSPTSKSSIPTGPPRRRRPVQRI